VGMQAAPIEVKRHLDAELEFETYYGRVSFEAGSQQDLACSLGPSEDDEESNSETLFESESLISWKMIGDGQLQNQFSPVQTFDPEEGVLRSSIQYTPKVEHQGWTIACSNEQTGKEDEIELNIFMYESNFEQIDTRAEIEEDLTVELEFRAFPPPSAEQVTWHCGSEMEDKQGFFWRSFGAGFD